jgi:hypothetical protein
MRGACAWRTAAVQVAQHRTPTGHATSPLKTVDRRHQELEPSVTLMAIRLYQAFPANRLLASATPDRLPHSAY